MRRKHVLLLAGLLLLVNPAVFLAYQLDDTTLASLGESVSATTAGNPYCNMSNSCPDPKSCGGWSTYYNCDEPFCMEDETCYYGGQGTYQLKERFRACILQDNSICNEYEWIGQRLSCHC